MSILFNPATADRWSDLERLFGPRGACGGCWCMVWRLSRAEYDAGKGAGNKSRLLSLMHGNVPPGVLAYVEGEVAGWCSIAPREEFPSLERSRILKRVDAETVWSITCLFVAKRYRRRGLSVELIKAAAKFAKRHGARMVEGYPHEAREKFSPDVFVWTGLTSAFRKAGFVECARRSKNRPIMRMKVESSLLE